jgi:hypothetical protein
MKGLRVYEIASYLEIESKDVIFWLDFLFGYKVKTAAEVLPGVFSQMLIDKVQSYISL